MSRNILLVIGVLLVGAAALLVDAMRLSPRAAFDERDGQRIDALLASRGALEMSVLEARAGLQLDFDPINRALSSQRDAVAAARALRARGASYASAAERLELAGRALEGDETAIEQFKTDLALLRLSSHYFPLAADALIRRAQAAVRRDQRSPFADELATLTALRTDVERYEELPAHDGVQRLEHGLSRLQTLRASLTSTPKRRSDPLDDGAREELDVVSGHARAILERRERVDRVTRLLARSPVRVHLEAARTAYERSARGQARRVGALQALSAVLALAGVSVLASVALRSVRGSTAP